jgi:hypothetical protein
VSQVFVSTDYGVISAKPLDKSHLGSLAKWLCQEKSIHDNYLSHLKISDRAWEQQVEKNGGYCDKCRDFAGEILSNFDLHTEVAQ